MLALRRLRAPHRALVRRSNATLHPTDVARPDAPPPPKPTLSPSPAPAPSSADAPPKTSGRRRRRTPIPPKRPDISLASPRAWNRPLAKGVIPAYDLGLALIQKDAFRLHAEARDVRAEVAELEKRVRELEGEVKMEKKLAVRGAAAEVKEEEAQEEVSLKSDELRAARDLVEERRRKLNILEVQKKVNLPDVRWKVSNAMADMSIPAHRHLVEQKWRNDGDLDLLMERLHQMHVIPDVLPDLRPTVDVHVVARTKVSERLATKKIHATVEPGTFLLPEQTVKPPSVYVNAFHTDTRLYTMLLVDPDVPDEANESFRTFLHWLKPNVPLSATTRTRLLLDGHTPYIPPHPQQGTPYHRYVLLLLPQPPRARAASAQQHPATREAWYTQSGQVSSQTLDIPPVGARERRDFDVRAFVERWGLGQGEGGGAHMWREVWSPRVSKIYQHVLNEPEPRFGRPPKADPYREYKLKKRYI
ncbi:hypothetical protein H0H87_005551 [Tephrocybe sp. NHM501043]|nr:hypothetical protein H0H87_005551 [Tephrocybe sp. NHM501043]